MRDAMAAIQARHSVRRYEAREVQPELVQRIQQACVAATPLDPAVEAGVTLVAQEALGGEPMLSGVGLLTRAPLYLVSHGPETPGRMEELGFRTERVILEATEAGLGSCWVGGMFRRETAARAVGCPTEDVVAITPMGYPEEGWRTRVGAGLVKVASVRLGKRRPLEETMHWQEWGQAVPEWALSPEVRQALEMARLAPSWNNLQPWHFVASERELVALADSRPQRGNDPPGRPYWRLDVGIAMCHFQLAMEQMGAPGAWVREQDEGVSPAGTPPHMVVIGRYLL